ncbi:efflux RND transporter permease subunit [Candidatus Uabimicrobium sp. HlEnr_7]|uniref:efflux RND transporter permease subunit n=1 Tax=Candidatus Uabimicrobium helgolandensis TaxID=3095367 RepID=UPI003557C99A
MKLFLNILTFRKIYMLVYLSIIMLGLVSFTKMPRQEDPTLKMSLMRVVIPFPGANPKKVEKLVTKIAEEEISEISSIEEMSCSSQNDFAMIDIQLDYDTDIYAEIEKIKNKIEDARNRFPAEVGKPIIFDDMAKNYPIVVILTSDKYEPYRLKKLMENFKSRCSGLPGVANAELRGEFENVIYISLDLEKISKYQIPIRKVLASLSSHNDLGPGGSIKAANHRYLIQTQGEFQHLHEIENVVVEISPGGNPVYVKDLATLVRDNKDPEYKIRYNGKHGVGLAINIKNKYNVLKLQKSVRKAMEEFAQDLPQGISIDFCIDQAQHVGEKLDDLYFNFFSGIVYVIIVLFIFLGFRESLIVSISIPITIVVALLFLDLLGIELQQISIASFVIALGLLVDNSIVIIENIYHHLQISKQGLLETFAVAVHEVAPSITSGTLTTIAAFIPLAAMPGDTGAYIRSIPIVVVTTLLSSLFVALSFTPILYLWLCQKSGIESGNPHKKDSEFLRLKYRVFIRFVLQKRYLFAFLGVLFLSFGGWQLLTMAKELFPTSDRSQFIINSYLPEGSTLKRCEQVSRKIEKKLQDKVKFPEIEKFVCFLGNGAPKFYVNEFGDKKPNNPGFIEAIVNLHKEIDGKKARSVKEMIRAVQQELDAVIFEAEIRVRPFRYGKPFPAPIILRIIGDNQNVIKKTAQELKEILKNIPGTLNVRDNLGENGYKIGIFTDTYRLNKLGLTHTNISSDVRIAFSGQKATSFRAGDEEIDVVVRLSEKNRQNFENIEQLYFSSNFSKEKIPFHQIGNLQLISEQGKINRWNERWAATILSDVSGKLPDEILQQFYKKIENYPLPSNIKISLEGEVKEINKTFKSLEKAGLFAFMLIFLLLALEFNSVFQPIIILLMLPLAISGALLGLNITNNPLAFMSILGFVSLMGIVVNDAIILIDFSNAQIRQGKQNVVASWESYTTVLLDAAEQRLKPIFTTSTTTIFSLLPLAFSGSVFWESFAWTIIFGLGIATFLTLVYVPVFFRIVEDIKVYFRITPSLQINVYTKNEKLQRELYHLLSVQNQLLFPEIDDVQTLEEKRADIVIIDEGQRTASELIQLIEKTRHAPHIASIIIAEQYNQPAILLEDIARENIVTTTSYTKYLTESSIYISPPELVDLPKKIKGVQEKISSVMINIWGLSRGK